MKEISQSIGQRIKTLMDFRNTDFDELQDYLECSEEYLDDILSNYDTPTITEMYDLANFFNVDVEFLILGNTDMLSKKLKEKVEDNIKNYDYLGKIDAAIKIMKKKLKEDGLPANFDTIPRFDKENLTFSSYGVFEEETFPIFLIEEDNNKVSISIEEFFDTDTLFYDLQRLLDLDLIKDLNSFDCISLSTLHDCDNLDVIRELMNKIEDEYTEEDAIDEYCDLLEELNPKLNNFWKIIVLLIENGAYYRNSEDYESKDEVRTNIVYRLALDMSK